MSQPKSTSTFLSPSKNESPDKEKRLKIEHAQLIGPSFVRLQALGSAGLSESQLDLICIGTKDGTSISKEFVLFSRTKRLVQS
jgi:hypothetical protein